ncbi:MAG TPA: AlkA N-terminal domain-containing protein [Gaiellaceae bacterium]|nr:AlkA N-terminal domain-containing protein [Gaiellaceae bacterium]HET8653309.1 AlkA N-terminal domain-containing protein [Gaiellaceae bacterium]
MNAYGAVVTTGIYCRPGCTAQPRAENVRTYALAAAAEAAGYRACLRCRPYRSAQPMWASGPELVCRAVGLILDGALDGGTEVGLGARLGVSARHLRRLFVHHLGVTPDGLARSARTHFARRLLDDTDLSILEIAFAAGFGSVRQLNRACRDVFRMAPRELRARRRVTDRLAADGGLVLRLPFRGPLDWQAMLDYFSSRAIPGVEHVSGGIYRRTIILEGDPGVLELLPGADDHLLLRAHLPHWRDLIHIVERARRIPSLDLDVDEPAGHLGDDPIIGPLVQARPGLRVPGTWDAFETGVRAIIGQQITVPAANTIAGRLVERLGTPVAGLGQLGLTHTFPSSETLATADLDGLGLTSARASAIRSFAEAVTGDAIRLDRSISLDRLVASVMAVDGLGPWTAQYLALRLGERDAWPITDVGLQRALSRRVRRRAASLGELAERWRPWRAFAATHLWVADSTHRGLVARVDAA